MAPADTKQNAAKPLRTARITAIFMFWFPRPLKSCSVNAKSAS